MQQREAEWAFLPPQQQEVFPAAGQLFRVVSQEAHRYGAQGVCLVLPAGLEAAQGEILRARLLESLGAMTATVADFAGARYAVRLGSARWSAAAPTSGAVLAAAEAALEEAAARAA